MSKVRTFSRYFPKGHPKAGEPTFFVEKFWKGLQTIGYSEPLYFFDELRDLSSVISAENYNDATPKIHTIRAGKHFKAGDYFSPRVWTAKPYASKQITIAEDIKLEKVFDIRIEIDKDYICVFVDDYPFYEENSRFVIQAEALETLAFNDGLSVTDFKSWFNWGKEPFNGQILSWTKAVEY